MRIKSMERTIQMHSGKLVSFVDPQPEDILLEDIEYHLARICRFNGACSKFYSVAQHSVHVMQCVDKEFEAQALMHDATEAYLGDIISPMKWFLEDLIGKPFRDLLCNFEEAIFDKFGISWPLSYQVVNADKSILIDEWMNFMPENPAFHRTTYWYLFPWSIDESQQRFHQEAIDIL